MAKYDHDLVKVSDRKSRSGMARYGYDLVNVLKMEIRGGQV